MKLVFRTEEYREMEFNFQNYPVIFFVIVVVVVVVKRGISQSLLAIQLISELADQRARKAQFICQLYTNLGCLFIIFSSILTNRSSQFSLILQHTMIVSAEIQVRGLFQVFKCHLTCNCRIKRGSENNSEINKF